MISNPRRVKIIAELSHQHGGDMDTLETMVLQAKFSGADFVKVQLFSSKNLFGDDRKEGLQLCFGEFRHIFNFSQNVGIKMFASVFDEKRLSWCKTLCVQHYKIASRVFGTPLCEKIIRVGYPVFVSNGNAPFDFRYKQSNLTYFYCLPEYPTLLHNVKIPDFDSEYQGYSDHSLGLTAAKVAVVKGAKYIEKHFTLSRNLQGNEAGHLGAMNAEELLELRRFCDEFAQIPS